MELSLDSIQKLIAYGYVPSGACRSTLNALSSDLRVLMCALDMKLLARSSCHRSLYLPTASFERCKYSVRSCMHTCWLMINIFTQLSLMPRGAMAVVISALRLRMLPLAAKHPAIESA